MLESFAVTSAGQVQYLFYDTVLDGKHLVTAVGIGQVDHGDAKITPIAQQTIEAALAYAESAFGASVTLLMQEIATLKAVPDRVAKALKNAENKSIVFFICRDTHIYDATVEQLRVQWKKSFRSTEGLN